ncbi:capsule assembly Wzi family protein [Candidatus Marinimicrobia bacterium]|nr:capsule assembly Wzi family protein [Candidatus Neomarinimicrobiota bacterium]
MYQRTKFLFFFLYLTIVLPNDGDFLYKIEYNSTSNEAWFKKYNNFGLEKENIFLETSYTTKINDKLNFSLNILISPYDLFYKDSFLSYNFTEKTYLKIGKYYRDYSKYLNDSLSSGHLLVSNNAQPLSKIGFNSSKKIRDVKFDFGLSHATLEKNDLYIKPPLIHEKYIYMSFLRGNNLFGIGFIHEAMWGGNIQDIGKQGESLKDFLKIFIAADGPLNEGDAHANALGNHLGLWEFVYEKKLQSNTIKIYHQHLFEDTSGLRFQNRYDGLWGILINSEKNSYLLEYLETTNQNIDPPYVDDAYYNHWLYDYGWSYEGFTIGNPHINPFEVVPLNVIHFASDINYNNKSLIFRMSKKTNIKSQINSMISFEYGKNDSFSVSLYNQKNKFGISFGYQKILKG